MTAHSDGDALRSDPMLKRLDILVVVGTERVPAALSNRARLVVWANDGEDLGELAGVLRERTPGFVGVTGGREAEAVAKRLRGYGFSSVLVVDGASKTAGPVTTVRYDPADAVERRVAVPAVERPRAMQVADSVLDLVGNTPLVRLKRVGASLRCQLLAKLEYLNPGGSVKDRSAITMVDAAEAAGLLTAGGVIVEPTSGNTGVGLAMVAAQRGYRCIFTVPDKVAEEKRQLLRAYGAEVVVCPTAVEPDDPNSYYSVARELVEATPGAFSPNQYHNPANPLAHEHGTGPEIWSQTAGRVTHVVAGAGTGGTLTGMARYLKKMNPSIKIVAADPEGSVYSGGGGRPYLVEGIGEDFWPTNYDRSLVDQVVCVPDAVSFATARRLVREEGVFAGGSTGTAVAAALEVAEHAGPDDVVVVIVPDSGRGYLSKLYNDQWMAEHGFATASAGPNVADVLGMKRSGMPALVHLHPDETLAAAISLIEEYGVSQFPVVKAEPPIVLGEVVGTVDDRSLLDRAGAGADLSFPVTTVMGPPLATVGLGEPVEAVAGRLAGAAAVLVLDGGHPIGICTRSDLLKFFSHR